MEIQQLWVDITTALAALIVFQLFHPSELVVNLFTHEDISLTSLGKSLHINDPYTVRLQVGMIEEQELELARIRSIRDEEIR